MEKLQTPGVIKKYSLSVFATGFVFFAAPFVSNASDFGSDLLTEGTSSDHVDTLEELLIDQEYLSEEQANGEYDNETAEAVSSFQEENDLLVDGIAGTQTLGSLSVLEKGDENALVEDLQTRLSEDGHYTGNLDGIFGTLTKDAVKSFQSATQIQIDGFAGPQTYAALYGDTPTSADENVEENSVQEPESEPAQEEAEEQEAPAEETAASASSGSSEASQSSSSSPEGTTMQMEATAYTADCDGCSGITATGLDLRNNPNKNVVAVDPNVIPLGSTVHVEGYGEAVAGDTGGAINGHKIDLHVPTKEEARNFGRQTVNVTVVD